MEITVNLKDLCEALDILAATPESALNECRRRAPLKLEALEGNGPANIIRLCEDAEREDTKDGVLDRVAEIEHQARLTLSYIAQIRAVIAPKWHDIVRKAQDARAGIEAAQRAAQDATTRPPLWGPYGGLKP